MAALAEHCPECGQMIYQIQRPWTVMQEVTVIDAGTRAAFVVEDLNPQPGIFGLPIMKLTEEIPAEVFTIHRCKEKP